MCAEASIKAAEFAVRVRGQLTGLLGGGGSGTDRPGGGHDGEHADQAADGALHSRTKIARVCP